MALQINLNQMYFFYMVVMHKGVRNAASFLHVSPPAVSAQLKRLEEALGFPLMIRTAGKLILTPQAENIFPEVEKLFMQAQEVEKHINSLQNKQINNLTLGGHFMHIQCIIPKLMPYLSSLKKECSLQLVADVQNALLEKLIQNEIHIALLEHCPPVEELHVQELFRSRIIMVACVQSPLGKNDSIHLHELENTPMLLPRFDSGFASLLQDFFTSMNFVPKRSEEFTLPINRRLIPQSSYITFFPEYFLDDENNGKQFQRITLKETLPDLSVSLAYAKNTSQESKIQNFLQSLPSCMQWRQHLQISA